MDGKDLVRGVVPGTHITARILATIEHTVLAQFFSIPLSRPFAYGLLFSFRHAA